jgi:ATP-dependent protease ClpP protease subunit
MLKVKDMLNGIIAKHTGQKPEKVHKIWKETNG